MPTIYFTLTLHDFTLTLHNESVQVILCSLQVQVQNFIPFYHIFNSLKIYSHWSHSGVLALCNAIIINDARFQRKRPILRVCWLKTQRPIKTKSCTTKNLVAKMQQAEIRRNRLGVFVSTLSEVTAFDIFSFPHLFVSLTRSQPEDDRLISTLDCSANVICAIVCR